jgi:CxxC-x17-CxxC domain-containing protein
MGFIQSGGKGGYGDGRQREMHKAICSECKKECEVPFKPSGDRPIYCKDCYSKRKAGSR